MKYTEASVKVGIHTGNIVKLHPSQAYLGINEGLIKILDITDAFDNFEVKSAVKNHIDDLGLDVDDSDSVAFITSLHESKWVKYEYTNVAQDGVFPGMEIGYLDLETLMNHITMY